MFNIENIKHYLKEQPKLIMKWFLGTILLLVLCTVAYYLYLQTDGYYDDQGNGVQVTDNEVIINGEKAFEYKILGKSLFAKEIEATYPNGNKKRLTLLQNEAVIQIADEAKNNTTVYHQQSKIIAFSHNPMNFHFGTYIFSVIIVLISSVLGLCYYISRQYYKIEKEKAEFNTLVEKGEALYATVVEIEQNYEDEDSEKVHMKLENNQIIVKSMPINQYHPGDSIVYKVVDHVIVVLG